MSQCVVGASLEEAEEEEDDAGSVVSGAVPPPKEGCYEIIGTLKDPASKIPDGVKEIIKVSFAFIFIVSNSIPCKHRLCCSLIPKKICMSNLSNVMSLFMTSQRIPIRLTKRFGQPQVETV